MSLRRTFARHLCQLFFRRLLPVLLVAMSLIGCASEPRKSLEPVTVQSLRENNPQARAFQICVRPNRVPVMANIWAYNYTLNEFVSDREPRRLRDFITYTDTIFQYNPWASPESAKLLPTFMGLSCPEPISLVPTPEEIEDGLSERKTVSISSEVHAELASMVEQTCKVAALEGANKRFIGQHGGAKPIILGGNNPQFQERVRQLLGIEKVPEPDSSSRSPVEASETPLRPIDSPAAQVAGGAVAGASIGFVPGGAIGADLAIRGGLLPEGTREARIGKACGEIIVGIGQIVVGCGGMGTGAGMSSTGGGALVGAPLFVGSLGLTVTGMGNCSAGAQQLVIELWRKDGGAEAGSSGPPAQTSAPAKPAPAAKPPQQPQQPPPPAKPAPTSPKAPGQSTQQGKPATPGTPLVTHTVTKVPCTGQWHHAITKQIHERLQVHKTLKNVYKHRDDRFVTQAINKQAHNGWEKWHRKMEAEVIDWLKTYDKATPADFEAFLRRLYKTDSDLNWRFPNGF